LERALGLTVNELNNPLAAGRSILERIEATNDRVNIVEQEVSTKGVPYYHGYENEDIEEWIAQVEALFTASGREVGANNTNIARYAIGGLRGPALNWYTERKAAGGGNLINWADADNDNDLKHRIKQKFISEEVRRGKLSELKYIKQREGESVENYATRFKKILRIANRGINLPDIFKVELFVDGLRSELVEQTRYGNLGNLNDAIERAKLVERIRGEKIQHEIYQEVNEKGVADILRKYSNPYRNKDNEIFQKMQEDVKDTNELEERLKKLEIKTLNNERRNDFRNVTCYTCGERGHTSRVCRQKVNRNFRNQRNGNNVRRNEQRNINYLGNYHNNDNDEYEDEEYDYEYGYDYEGEMYNTDIPTGKRRREEEERYENNVQNVKVKPRKKLSDETKWKMQMNRQASNKCSNCGQMGHYAKNCNNPPLEKQRLKVNPDDIEKFAEQEFLNSTVKLPRRDFMRLGGNKAIKGYKNAITNY
jgi:hypothetical protein